jgi:hypothetical protein
MYRFLVVPTCVAIAACATTGTEPDPSEAVQAAESRDYETLAINNPDTPAGNVMAGNDPAENSNRIQELESPEVSVTPPSMIPGIVEPEPAIVCERVVPTGSILPVKVCRSRSEIDRKEQADQEIFDDIKRNTAIFNSRL